MTARHVLIAARYEAAKGFASKLGFQLSIKTMFFVLSEDNSTV
jgi:hypothetical protein